MVDSANNPPLFVPRHLSDDDLATYRYYIVRSSGRYIDQYGKERMTFLEQAVSMDTARQIFNKLKSQNFEPDNIIRVGKYDETARLRGRLNPGIEHVCWRYMSDEIDPKPEMHGYDDAGSW